MKLVYDIKSRPDGLDIANLTKIYEQHHLVFWDSSKDGTKPRLFGEDGEPAPLKIVDTKGMEMDIEYYSEMFKDEEFWNKELHNCKNSPVYFFNNYGTTVWPATSEGIRGYLKSMGLEQIVAKDDEEAKILWEKQKHKAKEVADTYTIEFLKERQAVVQGLKALYQEKVVALESIVGEKVKLVDAQQQPLSERKRIANLVGKIRASSPVHPKYGEYRNAKGRWDSPMLFTTEYSKLLEIYDEVLAAENKGKDVLLPRSK